MTEQKALVFFDVGQKVDHDLLENLLHVLEKKGAKVEKMTLAGNYEQALDRLEQGAVPIVLRS